MPRHRAVVHDGDEADMPDQVIAAIRFGMDSIKQLCKDILSHCDPEMQETMIERLGSRYQQLIKAEMICEESSRIVNRAVEGLPNDENSSDTAILKSCENIADISQKGVEAFERTLTEACIKSTSQYKEFNEAVQAALSEATEEEEAAAEAGGMSSFDLQPDEVDTDEFDNDAGDDDEDEEGTGEVVPTTDPITKKPLKDPIRNKYCKHIYGQKAIMSLLKANPKFRCPTIGCSNKRFIKEAHLVEDEDLVANVRKEQGRKAGRRGKW